LAQGISFSPDNSKLYVSLVSSRGGKIVQYYGANFSKWQVVATAKQNFNGLRLGPDNQLYISINDDANHSPSSRVDVLLYPNELGSKVEYTENYLDLGDKRTTNYAFPTMIYDKSPIGGANKNDVLVKNICIGDTSFFSLTSEQMFDSVLWDFGDNSPKKNETNPHHIYDDTGSYTITATHFSCGQTWAITKTINIVKSPSINWPSDSVFCHNGELKLITPFNTGDFTWSTGEITQTINTKKEGLYWVNVVLGSCKVSDSIEVKELPPILIDLGEGYTVCEHDTDDLVKLDAGKGYNKYKWTPTQDTTQWIIVKQAGDYYVVVEDYRGCKGDDDSKVARLCGFDFHIPNAFTPNGDGLNDIFKPTALDILDVRFEIFNAWGERVFMTSNPQQGWDGTYKGKPSPQGIYLYKISFKGYSNKLLRNYNFKGNLSLLR
jgi:gliding motility-associated-like protein